MYLAQQLLDAADRGVRVRLLVDDMDARAKNAGFAALAAHPNIDVRMFNPFASRSGTLRLIGEGADDFGRINRRMHNKSWIADNRIAVVGGRNIGDEYFGASDEVNFVDLDFAMVGPVVRDASASFDKYWNSPSAYPMELLDAASRQRRRAGAIARRCSAAHAEQPRTAATPQALRADDAVKRLVARRLADAMVGNVPLRLRRSAQGDDDEARRAALAGRRGAGADGRRRHKRELTIISPYFVPGER